MMKYREFLKRGRFDFEEILAFAYGKLVDDSPEHCDAKFPALPFLMVDRILSIERDGKKGKIIAEQDFIPDAWYFQCRFQGYRL